MNLFIIRHGQSYGNLKEYSGMKNPKLTDTGISQAKKLGDYLKKYKLDTVLSSSYIRAISTANEIIKKQNHPVNFEIWPDLRETGEEFNYTPPTNDEIREMGIKYNKLKGFDVSIGPLTKFFKLYERYNRRRAKTEINLILKKFKDMKNVVIVAHGTFNRYLMCALLGLNPKKHFMGQGNTCINLFEIENKRIKIQKINNGSHLKTAKIR